MNNNTTEDYCSFEVSKLLKEKGFGVPCNYYYLEKDYAELLNRNRKNLGLSERFEEGQVAQQLNKYHKGRLVNRNQYDTTTSRPTHALAIKWIRENFGIHITSQQIWYSKNTKIAYFYLIYKNPEEDLGNHEDRFAEILEGSYQEVKGNYVNDEKYDKLLFDTKFAFNSPEQAVEAALLYTLKNLIP